MDGEALEVVAQQLYDGARVFLFCVDSINGLHVCAGNSGSAYSLHIRILRI